MSERYVIEIKRLGSAEMVEIWGASGTDAQRTALDMQSLLPVDIREFTNVVRVSETREVIS